MLLFCLIAARLSSTFVTDEICRFVSLVRLIIILGSKGTTHGIPQSRDLFNFLLYFDVESRDITVPLVKLFDDIFVTLIEFFVISS